MEHKIYHLKYLERSIQCCSGHFLPHSTFPPYESERQILPMNGNTQHFMTVHISDRRTCRASHSHYEFSPFQQLWLQSLRISLPSFPTHRPSWRQALTPENSVPQGFSQLPIPGGVWILFLMVGQLSLHLQTDLAASSGPSPGSPSSPNLPYRACIAQPCCSCSHLPCCFCPRISPSFAAAPTRRLKTWSFFFCSVLFSVLHGLCWKGFLWTFSLPHCLKLDRDSP